MRLRVPGRLAHARFGEAGGRYVADDSRACHTTDPVATMFEFLMGVLSSLAATWLLAAFSPKVRLFLLKRLRILRRLTQRVTHRSLTGPQMVQGERTLNVAIALSGNTPYLVDMEQAFVAEARTVLEREGILIHVERSLGAPTVQHLRNGRALHELLNSFGGSKPDVIVTVGSAVSTYVRTVHVGIPQIFIGVTDPIAAGLCRTLAPDSARGDIAGVTFSVTAADRLQFLLELFPSRRFGYVYNATYSADMHHLHAVRAAARQLGASVREIQLTSPEIPEPRRLEIDVIFGWLYLHEHISEFVATARMPVVGGGWVDLRKGACCCISDDEREMGKLAASHVLYDYVINRVPLSQLPIEAPSGNVRQRLMIGLNLDAAARYGISFPSQLVDVARFRIRENRRG